MANLKYLECSDLNKIGDTLTDHCNRYFMVASLCTGCKRVSIEFSTYTATKKKTVALMQNAIIVYISFNATDQMKLLRSCSTNR